MFCIPNKKKILRLSIVKNDTKEAKIWLVKMKIKKNLIRLIYMSL